MASHRTFHPPASKEEVNRIAVFKKISGERSASAKGASKFLFQMLKLMKAYPSFRINREETIRESIPLCFANLEGQRKAEFGRMVERLPGFSLKIAAGPNGEEFFAWAMRRAFNIVKAEEEQNGPAKLLLLFEACTVVASFGKEFEVDQFMWSYKNIETPKRQVFLESIKASTNYESLHLVLGTANQRLFGEITKETF